MMFINVVMVFFLIFVCIVCNVCWIKLNKCKEINLVMCIIMFLEECFERYNFKLNLFDIFRSYN